MKTYHTLLACILFCCFITLNAFTGNEDKNFSSFYQKQQQKEQVTSFRVSGKLVEAFFNDEENLDHTKEQINEISLLMLEDASSQQKFAQELNQHLPNSLYQDLMVINSDGDQVKFKIRKQGNMVREIIITAQSEGSVFALSISGKFKLERAKELVKAVNMKEVKSS